jgi:copper transport protein
VEWIIARWITFIATIVVLGVCAVGMALLPRASRAIAARSSLARTAAHVGAVACGGMLFGSMGRLVDQLQALRSPGDAMLTGLSSLLFATTWGTGFLWQTLAALVLLGLFVWLRTHHQSLAAWWAVCLPASVLAWSPSLQGHAIGSEQFTSIAVAADIAHVAGAGIWLGSVAVVGWLGASVSTFGGRAVSEEDADAALRVLVPLLPPLALTGAAMLLLSGGVATVLHLRAVDDFWTTLWGRYVLLKVILVSVVLALGARNWRRLGPRMDSLHGVTALRRSLVTELIVSALLVLVTAVLVVTPLPGE